MRSPVDRPCCAKTIVSVAVLTSFCGTKKSVSGLPITSVSALMSAITSTRPPAVTTELSPMLAYTTGFTRPLVATSPTLTAPIDTARASAVALARCDSAATRTSPPASTRAPMPIDAVMRGATVLVAVKPMPEPKPPEPSTARELPSSVLEASSVTSPAMLICAPSPISALVAWRSVASIVALMALASRPTPTLVIEALATEVACASSCRERALSTAPPLTSACVVPSTIASMSMIATLSPPTLTPLLVDVALATLFASTSICASFAFTTAVLPMVASTTADSATVATGTMPAAAIRPTETASAVAVAVWRPSASSRIRPASVTSPSSVAATPPPAMARNCETFKVSTSEPDPASDSAVAVLLPVASTTSEPLVSTLPFAPTLASTSAVSVTSATAPLMPRLTAPEMATPIVVAVAVFAASAAMRTPEASSTSPSIVARVAPRT